MFSRDSAWPILRRGLLSNNDCTFSISPSLIRGPPLPPLSAIFPAVKNCSCQRSMAFCVGSALLIDLPVHLRVVIVEPVLMYFATMCAFSESVYAILRILSKLGISIGQFLEPMKFDGFEKQKSTLLFL